MGAIKIRCKPESKCGYTFTEKTGRSKRSMNGEPSPIHLVRVIQELALLY